MTTYHGITAVTCPACGYHSEDDYTLTVINDQTGECPRCGYELDGTEFTLVGP